MDKRFVALGAAFAFLGVLIGAFGAHALQATLETNGTRATYETGVQYQLIHAVGLLFLGLMQMREPSRKLEWAGKLMAAGILLFSFSLYTLALTGIRVLGAVTPFGGLCFLVAWVLVLSWALESTKDSTS